MTTPAYCTILARNYLPSALTLSDSLRRHDSEFPLVVFLIDATAETELPDIEGVRWMRPASLELPERTLLELAMSYDPRRVRHGGQAVGDASLAPRPRAGRLPRSGHLPGVPDARTRSGTRCGLGHCADAPTTWNLLRAETSSQKVTYSTSGSTTSASAPSTGTRRDSWPGGGAT